MRELEGLPSSILLVPLPGHTLGHVAIVIGSDRGWLTMAGDAYFHHLEMDLDRPWCTPGLRMYQTLMEKDRRARLANQQRLRDLLRSHGDDVRVVCSHDPVEFEQSSGRGLTHHCPRAVPRGCASTFARLNADALLAQLSDAVVGADRRRNDPSVEPGIPSTSSMRPVRRRDEVSN